MVVVVVARGVYQGPWLWLWRWCESDEGLQVLCLEVGGVRETGEHGGQCVLVAAPLLHQCGRHALSWP